MDDRRRIPGGEGSPRALCDRDSSTLAQGVDAEDTVRGRRHRRLGVTAKDPEIDRALDAMSAPELRAAVRAVLEEFDEDVRASVVDALIARATKATSGWRPTRPSQRIVEEAKSFADAARHVGHADPDDVTEHLRRATKAFLAGDHASARAVFEAILPPIASVDIDLGQHELVEEVLGVDARACVAQYVASVDTTTPLRNRADAMLRAIEQVQDVGTLLCPIKDMEDVSLGTLPDLGAFLPLWVKRLERFRQSKGEWETEHERIRTKAARSLARCSKTATRQIGLLRVLVGDVTGAAAVLAKSPGLGWSNPDHPGHTLFPLLAMLLSNGTIGGAFVTELEATGRDPLEPFTVPDEEHKPRLRRPSVVVLIQSVRPTIALTDRDRDAAIDAMRIAAEKRTEGILDNSRRQHYGHATLLVASCVAFAPKSRASELLRWATDLRQRYSRRHAFRQELARACESLDVFVPDL